MIQRAAAGWNVPQELNRDEKMYRFMPTHNRWIMIILVLMVVSMTAVQMVSAAGEQSWHLLDDVYTGTVAGDGTYHYKDLFMNKTGITLLDNIWCFLT